VHPRVCAVAARRSSFQTAALGPSICSRGDDLGVNHVTGAPALAGGDHCGTIVGGIDNLHAGVGLLVVVSCSMA